MEALKKSKKFAGPAGPVVLVIMDGVGIGKHEEGDFVRAASTPTMDWLKANTVNSQLKAHGRAVGLPSDEDMGNSEVGHNAIGCGRVFDQGAQLVNNAIASRSIFEGAVWKELISNCKANQSTLHFIGLFSDGNVHSHIDQLKGMLNEAAAEGIARVCLHPLLDGRDVPPTSALTYIDDIEAFFGEKNAAGKTQFLIASGGGRMVITMDRYNANWSMVELGWKTHVKGEGRFFATAREAIETFRNEKPGIIDQDLPPFVIAKNGRAVGPITDGDSVIYFNFRGDRAIEMSRAFEEDNLEYFDRGSRPKVMFAGMMEYDGDLHIPKKFLVEPPAIDRTLDEYLIKSGVTQLAISETQKYGHVTYFFNGNRSGKFSDTLEDYIEIPSDIVPFEQRPWMKGAEITDRVIAAIESGKYKFIRLNYPNGDMVGHTGIFEAVRIAVETVDLCLARLIEAVKKAGGIMVISADHGNADDMYERSKKTGQPAIDPHTGGPQAKTSHSLNPVPVYIYAPANKDQIKLSDAKDLGIASLAATCIKLLGFEPPADYAPSIVDAG
ncbi:MAG TPA: 2,3-bisphosphoglycerate-independent phosphoglycerate mutase [Kiritimatiellia bacterium]|nr:2,3-bisphosphoglycerate-independent phosphoglycerate mutase [Kiritimatiellia bacterium]